MEPIVIRSAVEQVTQHLRTELLRGSGGGLVPGAHPLAEELGVNHKTVRAALRQLEDEGFVVDQGKGRPRRVVESEDYAPPRLRVGLLVFDRMSQDFMTTLRHLLEKSGHSPFFPGKNLQELGMDPVRVMRVVRRAEADAWVVVSASREVLERFVEEGIPAFALAGRRDGLPIAGTGPDKAPAFGEVTRRLIALGHRRIATMCRRPIRLPQPARSLRAIMDELEAAGIATGPYNFPDWDESREGFGRALDSLFEHTPPTALILDEPYLYHAAYHYLATRGLRVPEDVSLVCTDGDHGFVWCRPTVAHIRWDLNAVVRRIVRWTNNVSRGVSDRRQSLTKAEFVDGGTVGRAPVV